MVWFAKESAILRPVGHDRIEGAAATTTADTRRMTPTNFNTRCKMLLINSPRPPALCLYGSSTWAQESFPQRLPPSEAHTYNVKLLSLVPFNSCWCTRKLPTFLLKKWELWSHKRSKNPQNRSTTILTLPTNFQLSMVLNHPWILAQMRERERVSIHSHQQTKYTQYINAHKEHHGCLLVWACLSKSMAWKQKAWWIDKPESSVVLAEEETASVWDSPTSSRSRL